MMKIFLPIVFLFMLGQQAKAQPGGGQRDEKIEALRVAFITRQLDLSADEAKKFWPTYDQFQKEMQKLMQEQRQKGADELEFEEKMLNLRKKYKPEFLKAIPEEKFNKLLRVDREFREVIRKELERRRMNMQQGRGAPGMRNNFPRP
jgi:hypothetical protein